MDPDNRYRRLWIIVLNREIDMPVKYAGQNSISETDGNTHFSTPFEARVLCLDKYRTPDR